MDRRETRTLLAAAGAVALLVAAALLAFGSLGSTVGFDGFPKRTSAAPEGEVHVRGVRVTAGSSSGSDAPDAARESDAVAQASADAAPVLAQAGRDERDTPGSVTTETPEGPGDPDPPAPTEPEEPEDVPPAPADPPVVDPMAPPPTQAADESGLISEPVATLDGVVGGLSGIDPPLAEATAPVTEPVENILAAGTGG